MDMIFTEFIMFTVISGINAYLPNFLRIQGFTPTDIGYLYGIFNAFGIMVPLLLVPLISKKGKYSWWLMALAGLQVVVPVALFNVSGFWLTGIFMALFAVTYRGQIPVSDSIITQSLGNNQERYGIIRVSGTVGFIVMSLVMQKFVNLETITRKEMGLWFSIPSVLFVLSLAVREVFIFIKKRNGSEDNGVQEKVIHKDEEDLQEVSTIQVLKSFGPEFYFILFIVFSEFLGMVPSNQFLSIYATDVLGTDISGLLWAINSIFELPFMFASGWIIKKFGEKKLIVLCTAAVILRLMCYAFIPTVAGTILGQCFHSLTYGLFFPACISYCSRCAGNSRKANITAMTLMNTVTTLPAIIGAAAGGVIIDALGYRALFLIFSIFPAAAVILYFIRLCRVQR